MERSKKVGMYLQIHSDEHKEGKTSDSLLRNFIDKNAIQADTVKNTLIQQQDDLERRLLRRKSNLHSYYANQLTYVTIFLQQ